MTTPAIAPRANAGTASPVAIASSDRDQRAAPSPARRSVIGAHLGQPGDLRQPAGKQRHRGKDGRQAPGERDQQMMAACQVSPLVRRRRRQLSRIQHRAGGSVVVVLAVVLTLIVVKLSQSPPAAGGTSASPAVARQVTTVPAATFDSVGKGSATGLKATSGQPLLTAAGKPEVLYMGGEYCPFCAAERWAIAAALSRFGTFSGLNFIHSSPTDTYPNTPTLSFYKSGYTSKYVSFVPVEWYGQAADGSTPFGHVYLQQPTSAQQALFTKSAGGSFPFVDIGNQYLVPQVLTSV